MSIYYTSLMNLPIKPTEPTFLNKIEVIRMNVTYFHRDLSGLFTYDNFNKPYLF